MSASADEARIRELEDLRFEAVVAGDFDAFASYSHPDLLYTHSNAVTDTLEQYMTKCREGFYVYHSIAHPIDRILFTQDTALVFGEMKADLTAAGTRKQLDNTSLAVWQRVDDDWKLLAYQPTVKPA